MCCSSRVFPSLFYSMHIDFINSLKTHTNTILNVTNSCFMILSFSVLKWMLPSALFIDFNAYNLLKAHFSGEMNNYCIHIVSLNNNTELGNSPSIYYKHQSNIWIQQMFLSFKSSHIFIVPCYTCVIRDWWCVILCQHESDWQIVQRLCVTICCFGGGGGGDTLRINTRLLNKKHISNTDRVSSRCSTYFVLTKIHTYIYQTTLLLFRHGLLRK